MALLEEAVSILQVYPKIKIRIIGFTDKHECSPSSECKELSRRRAQAVYAWLLAHGVVSGRVIAVEARGNEEPLDSNEAEGGRQHNRRVEIRISDVD